MSSQHFRLLAKAGHCSCRCLGKAIGREGWLFLAYRLFFSFFTSNPKSLTVVTAGLIH